MPFHDVPMMALADWVYRRELHRCQMREDHIRECLEQLGRLHKREPANQIHQQRYGDTWTGLRCILVELSAEELVSKWCFAWAQAYLAVKPMVRYMKQGGTENESKRGRRAITASSFCGRQASFGPFGEIDLGPAEATFRQAPPKIHLLRYVRLDVAT
ncbi:uncharacterized protein M421DRAFT_88650 [Didymella exigua CBS 183.55]|uniref:Uncharacterized protein n=1 Tax=Didymella exigua CBS 183.55 TaxID=1150837 RepID=A0A6A5RYH2_9PLEO|nr:uncharacterized protein M421DRAFT_88650 [Didymella exigua CBS 183.55]KAF1933431.1 hypothetical protein M421DRAFT_88650 [Didymella exigua CBS 183.55]